MIHWRAQAGRAVVGVVGFASRRRQRRQVAPTCRTPDERSRKYATPGAGLVRSMAGAIGGWTR